MVLLEQQAPYNNYSKMTVTFHFILFALLFEQDYYAHVFCIS